VKKEDYLKTVLKISLETAADMLSWPVLFCVEKQGGDVS